MRARVGTVPLWVTGALLAAAPFARGAEGVDATLAAAACVPDATTLCIDGLQAGDRRFKIQVDWSTVQGGGQGGAGTAVSTAPIGFSAGGLFWFFDASNPEMLVKVVNGCAVNQKFWVFTSAGTNVGLTTRVSDTLAGTVATYTNPDLTPAAPVQDVNAFPCSVVPPDEITVFLPGDVPLVLRKVPAGTFQMGSPYAERNRLDNETPHQVTLTKDYYMGKYLVTQRQWKALMGSNPSSFTTCGDTCPVEMVSWNDVAGPGGLIEKLHQHLTATGQAGAGKFRLPSEAEWERAARGGTQTRFSFGDALDSDDACGTSAQASPYVWWCGTQLGSGIGPHPVGAKTPNPYGLYDVHGNVSEWCQDWAWTYPSTPQVDPTGPAFDTGYRDVRGGGWTDRLQDVRVAFRVMGTPDSKNYHLGFRLARSL